MYTITFYSFKGGVGRTMAMANVGFSMARSGRRVLLVDFDLEAPGLDTFALLRPSQPTCGVVDFVDEYRKTRVAPDIKNFIYEPINEELEGRLWVMPTGKQDPGYGRRLNSIDWRQLYEEEDGYLLFEDLKQQWARELRPDYVLIDSRTGHTDVGGICTRQLPEAVVLLFFPNEQNRRGLEVVLRDIQRESQESGRNIDLYFVPSNVPDLDDEHGILRDRFRGFEKTFESTLDWTIHHYDSLSLLDQTIFTKERPHTKLALEYEGLMKSITSRNLEDKEVAAGFLESVISNRERVRRVRPAEVNRRLQKIKELYSQDGEIVYALAEATRSLGREKDAQELFEVAGELGFLPVEKMAEVAAAEYAKGAREQARVRVQRGIMSPTNQVFALEQLLSVVVAHDVGYLRFALGQVSTTKIDPRETLYLASRLEVKREALPAIEEFVKPVLSSNEPDVSRVARIEVSLCLIGQRRFDEAVVFLQEHPSLAELDIPNIFNYAMAEWGRTGKPSTDLFRRVIEVDAKGALGMPTANYFLCISLANWVVGRVDQARILLEKARSSPIHDLEFSAWRYLRVTKDDLLRDIDAQEAMIATGIGQPILFLDESQISKSGQGNEGAA